MPAADHILFNRHYVLGYSYYFRQAKWALCGTFKYEYFLKDHLGNTRVTFNENSGSIDVIQQDHYYPFGMNFAGIENAQIATTTNFYKYNGKEYQDSHDLNWYDYGARFYDPMIARWHSIDPLAEKYFEWSPYNYVSNNPIFYFDYNGLEGIKYDELPHTTQLEKDLILKYPFSAKKLFKNRNTAHGVTQHYFGKYGGKARVGLNDNADAFRHMFFSAINAQSIGKGRARQFGDAHETETKKEEANQKIMDLNNNLIGLEIGANNPDASILEIAQLVFDAFESGTVLVIDPKTGKLVKSKKKPKTVKPKPKPKPKKKKKKKVKHV